MSRDTVVLAPAGYVVDRSHGSDLERPWQFARALARRGVRVVLVAREVRDEEGLGSGVEVEAVTGSVPHTPAGQVLDRARLYAHARRIARREVRSGRVLAVHHFGPCGPWTPSFVGHLPVPFVYGPLPALDPGTWHRDEWIVHWLELQPGTNRQRRAGALVFAAGRRVGAPLMRRTLRRADAVTVEVAENRPAQRPDAFVIPPGIDLDLFRPDAAIRRVVGRIVAAGALLPRKGYDVLIRAVAALRAGGVAAELVVAGTGPQEEELRALARQLGVESCVQLVGKLSRAELVPLLQSAAAFCHPARFDNYPFAPLEAMACGVPTLVSNFPSLRDAVGDAGMVHAIGDHVELARQLGAVLGDPARQSALSAACRQRAVNRFSWDSIAAQHIDLYCRLDSEWAPHGTTRRAAQDAPR